MVYLVLLGHAWPHWGNMCVYNGSSCQHLVVYTIVSLFTPTSCLGCSEAWTFLVSGLGHLTRWLSVAYGGVGCVISNDGLPSRVLDSW